MRVLKSEKGILLMVAFLVILVSSVYLASYVTWTIWDQRNFTRLQTTEQVDELARAGLNQVILDLNLDSNSWLDGKINGHNITSPDSGNPNVFYDFYTVNLENGSYHAELRYLYNTARGSFYDKRMWVRVTGTSGSNTRQLEQLVNCEVVKNLTQDKLYTGLQLAVDDAADNDNIGIAAVTLTENVLINYATPKLFNIKGCYNNDFTIRSCSNFPSTLKGRLQVTGQAQVDLSGLTIE